MTTRAKEISDLGNTGYLEVDSNGNVGIGTSSPGTKLHVSGSFKVQDGASSMLFQEYDNGATIWLDGADGDFSGGDYYGIYANNTGGFGIGYAGSSSFNINSSGNVGIGTSNPSSKLNVVVSDNVIEAEIGTVNNGHKFTSQSDVGYDGFQIYQQHGNNTTRNSFSVQDNRSGSKSPAFAIRGDGRVSIGEVTPINNSALTIGGSFNTSYNSTIYFDNNYTGGSDGFILTTDDTWTIKTNAGQGGMAIGTGTPGSGTVKIYVGDDGTITMGKNVNSYVATSGDSGTELHVTGPISFGQGNTSEWSKAGRRVLGWYSTTYHSSGSYTHIETDLWGGGSPYGQSEYIMGGFEIRGYRYASPGHSFEMIGFHNWGGSLAAYNVASMGNWSAGCIAYVGSNGYVYIRVPNGAYYGFIIDVYQYAWYPIRDINVVNIHQNSTANM